MKFPRPRPRPLAPSVATLPPIAFRAEKVFNNFEMVGEDVLEGKGMRVEAFEVTGRRRREGGIEESGIAAVFRRERETRIDLK